MDIEKTTFITLFKDLVARLYDWVALESHPLANYFPNPPDASIRRADFIRDLIVGEIEQLRPAGQESPQSSEWRPYLILKNRYIIGQDPGTIARSLYIGDRQFRRDHSRAMLVLSTTVWHKYFQSSTSPQGPLAGGQEEQEPFEDHPEHLDMNEILSGLEPVFKRRLEVEGVTLKIDRSSQPFQIQADRVLVRQILLSLMNFALHFHDRPSLEIITRTGRVNSLKILFSAEEDWDSVKADEQDALDFVQRWCPRIPAELEVVFPSKGRGGAAELRLIFPSRQEKTILIVDDQAAAQRMFQRYLSQTGLLVIGITDPTHVMEKVQEKQPAMIILDVMMPHIDGWEVLQKLQLDPLARKIPVIVCSAWMESELAFSLGAAGFLKKPVIQKDLLQLISDLHLG